MTKGDSPLQAYKDDLRQRQEALKKLTVKTNIKAGAGNNNNNNPRYP